jgi:HD-GYP domain-containing protein (c-di-GMP phosphodiesterase class II)
MSDLSLVSRFLVIRATSQESRVTSHEPMSQINYKHELESASRTMIMIHDPNLLIRMIIRTIVQKVRVQHAGVIVHDENRYVLTISRGERGAKIPEGFARFEDKSPVIKIFKDESCRRLLKNRHAILAREINTLLWQESVLKEEDSGGKKLLNDVLKQMDLFNADACVPAYYQKELLAVLLLGPKEGERHFDKEEVDFFAALASDAAMAIRNAQLFERLRREADRNRKLFVQITLALNSTIEAKDAYTRGHTERVTSYALAIAHRMHMDGTANFSKKFFDNLQIGGLLHDIGKIGISETILGKQEPLTSDEFQVMKQHTLKGAEILKHLTELDEESLYCVKYHHERFDGGGYPEGLKGDEIPLIAAILAVADTYDAMTSDRPYRKGLSSEVAMKEIEKNIGTQFHPLPGQAMVLLLKEGKI